MTPPSEGCPVIAMASSPVADSRKRQREEDGIPPTPAEGTKTINSSSTTPGSSSTTRGSSSSTSAEVPPAEECPKAPRKNTRWLKRSTPHSDLRKTLFDGYALLHPAPVHRTGRRLLSCSTDEGVPGSILAPHAPLVSE